MGIEPKRPPLRSLQNAAFGEGLILARDWRVNFRGMWDNVGPPESTTLGRSSQLGWVFFQEGHLCAITPFDTKKRASPF